MFSQVLNQIRVNHPDSVDSHELLMAAIQGMVHAADPHSFVIPYVRLSPAREQAFKEGKLFPFPIEFEYLQRRARRRRASPPAPRRRGRTFFPATSSWPSMESPSTAESADELERDARRRQGHDTTLSLERLRSDGRSRASSAA